MPSPERDGITSHPIPMFDILRPLYFEVGRFWQRKAKRYFMVGTSGHVISGTTCEITRNEQPEPAQVTAQTGLHRREEESTGTYQHLTHEKRQE